MIIDALMSMRVDERLVLVWWWPRSDINDFLYSVRYSWESAVWASTRQKIDKLKNYFVIHACIVLCALYQGSIIQTCVENFKFKIKQQTEVLNIIAVLSWLC